MIINYKDILCYNSKGVYCKKNNGTEFVPYEEVSQIDVLGNEVTTMPATLYQQVYGILYTRENR